MQKNMLNFVQCLISKVGEVPAFLFINTFSHSTEIFYMDYQMVLSKAQNQVSFALKFQRFRGVQLFLFVLGPRKGSKTKWDGKKKWGILEKTKIKI